MRRSWACCNDVSSGSKRFSTGSDSRNAVSEALGHGGGGDTLSANNNLDLRTVSRGTSNRLFESETHLHRTVVDLDAVQFVCGLSGTSCLDEDDGGGAAAATSRSVGEHDLLDSSHRFAEVVLNEFPC